MSTMKGLPMTNTTNRFAAIMDKKAKANTTTKTELAVDERNEKRIMTLTKAIAHSIKGNSEWRLVAEQDLELKENVKDIHKPRKHAWRIIMDKEEYVNAIDTLCESEDLREVAIGLKAIFTVYEDEVVERKIIWDEVSNMEEDELKKVQKKMGLI
jgi:hypothetical protein